LSHLAATSRVLDSGTGAPLRPEAQTSTAFAELEIDLTAAEGEIFSDDFESGGLAAWSGP
ncbi:MAG: hypothetical protein AAF725_24805, partial [Acidobacteriota bacterium]